MTVGGRLLNKIEAQEFRLDTSGILSMQIAHKRKSADLSGLGPGPLAPGCLGTSGFRRNLNVRLWRLLAARISGPISSLPDGQPSPLYPPRFLRVI